MNLKKKLFVSVLFTLTLTLILGTSVFADSTYITFDQASLSDSSAGYDYVYDSQNNTGVLTLDGYDGAAIYLGVETEIILAEGSTNTITVATNNEYFKTWGIDAHWASLTISGSGTLNINVDMRGIVCMYGMYGVKAEGVLTIKDEANLNINIKSDGSDGPCYGLWAGHGIITQDTVTLDIDMETADTSYGIYTYGDLINISGTGDKNITMSGDAEFIGVFNCGTKEELEENNYIKIDGEQNIVIEISEDSTKSTTGIRNNTSTNGQIAILNGANVTISGASTGIAESSDEGDGEKCGIVIDSSEVTINTRNYGNGIYSKYNMMDVKDSELDINSKGGYSLHFYNSQAYTRGINITGKSIVNLTTSRDQVVLTNIGTTISNIDLTTGGKVTISSTYPYYADASIWYGLVKIGENTVVKQGNEEEVTKPGTPEYADAKLYGGTGTPITLIFEANDGFEVTSPTFANATYGYSSITALPISIKAIDADRTIESVTVSDTSKFTVNGSGKPTITSGNTDNTTFTINPLTGLDAGTHTATITVEDSESKKYTATVTFVVEKANITPTVSIGNWVYGGTANTPTVTGNLGGGSENFRYKGEYHDSSETPTNAGTYKVIATIGETENYNQATCEKTFEITKKIINVDNSRLTINSKNFDDTTDVEATSTGAYSELDNQITTTATMDGGYDKYVGAKKGTITATLSNTAYNNYSFADNSQTHTKTNVDFNINAVTSTLAQAQATNYQLVKGQGVDLNTLVTLNPSAYNSDVTFALVGTPTGITLANEELSATASAATGEVKVKVNFAGKHLGGSEDLEYSAATELELTIDVIDKTPVTLGGLTYTNKTYNGTAVTPTGTLTFSEGSLTIDDVDVTYTGRDGTNYSSTTAPVNAGKYTVTYTIENTNALYTGTVSYDFEITKAKLAKPAATTETFTFDNSEKTLNVNNVVSQITQTSGTLTENYVGSYSVTYELTDTTNYCWSDDDTTTPVTIDWSITPVTSTLVRNSNSNKLAQGKEVDLKTLVNLDPSSLIDEVTFTIELLPTGVTLDGTTLKAANDATLGNVTVKANFAGKDLNSDEAKEYSTATEVTFDVEIAKKPSSGGSGSSSVTKYDIKIQANEGGTVKATPTSVEKGEDSKLKVSAYEGYEIEDVTVDGESVGAVKEYTIKNVKKDIKVEVTFKKIENNTGKEEVKVENFKDVNPSDWFYNAVKFAVENKLMNGTSKTTFEPEATTTRAMVVTILYRLENEASVTRNNVFSDVKNGMWYSDAIAWANEKGIVLGTGNGEFAPNAEITREQLVTILYRYANYKKLDTSIGESTNILSYDDAFEISEYAIPAFQWACGEALVSGVGENLLAPQENATRAQIATIMMRFIEKM